MVKKSFILILSMSLPALVSGYVSAQSEVGSIRGIVTDVDFKAPLGGAKIVCVEAQREVETNELGTFVIDKLKPGRYTLIISKEGYTKQIKPQVLVTPGGLSEVDGALSGDIVEMEEFIVEDPAGMVGSGAESGLLKLRFESPVLMDSIGAELMKKAGAGDAGSALRLVAGATVREGKTAVIRGLPDRYVSSQLNGVRMPSADEDKRAVELDQFSSAVIESVQVAKTFTPDQQGDASGGAVNIRLRGLPDVDYFFKIEGQSSQDSQTSGRGKFLSYEGGGVNGLGRDGSRRRMQLHRLGEDWEGAVGTTRQGAPVNYKLSSSGGGKYRFDSGLTVGTMASLFYDRDSSSKSRAKDDTYWIETPGEPMTPKSFQGAVQGGDFKTSLFDVTQGKESVQWGGLASIGAEYRDHSLSLIYMYTRSTEDTATLAEDTRGKKHFFPGHDPYDPESPGHGDPDAAPYLRLETLEYRERTTDTLQLNGRHKFEIGSGWTFKDPELEWTLSRSQAALYQPDKRQFGSAWYPGRKIGPIEIPGYHAPFKPSANFTLGNLQRIWKSIDEESNQLALDLKLPFEQWSGVEGYFKVGLFRDRVKRKFDQDTFSNFSDNSTFDAPFNKKWSSVFQFESHPVTESTYDVDYRGELETRAWYAMIDLPIFSTLNLIGGARLESTKIDIKNDPEEDATWFPPGSLTQTVLERGQGDVAYDQSDVLPSIGLIYRPSDLLTLRGSMSKTLARQTFKELTPILQQEYLGGPVFIGNPNLQMSSVKNYDLRIDVTPREGSLVSLSWFRKDIKNPIEYVQKIADFNFTSAINYPVGKLSGWEFEARQDLESVWGYLSGISIGGNATLIDSEVKLSSEEIAVFAAPNIAVDMRKRTMTDAPDYLYNLYLLYEPDQIGLRLGVFYTVQGDSLAEGAAESQGNYVPNVISKKYDTLNINISQELSDNVRLVFRVKNLTDPDIKTKYEGGMTKTSYTKGVEYMVGLSADF